MHGVGPPTPLLDEHATVIAALERGEMGEAVRQTTPEISEALTVAGTPGECAERIRADLVEAGIDNILLALVDPVAVAAYTGNRPEDLPEAREQLRLVRDRLAPVLDSSR